LRAKGSTKNVSIELPVDHVVAPGLESAASQVISITETPPDQMGLDIGPETIRRYSGIIRQAKTIVWNGPMGVFENPKFAAGTFAIARAVADSNAYSIVGGGDSAAAVAQSGVGSKITHISTGGGASLEFLSGQNVHWEKEGAFTGEVSVRMLVEAGCTYTIIGHSERRQYFGETDETVEKKTLASLGGGLEAIVCVGETLSERDSGGAFDVVRR